MSETITAVLVHGAFAESASWNDVLTRLSQSGISAVAVPNQLRGVASDAENVRRVVASIDGPVLLVGHSYGGTVITEAASGDAKVKGLVYVAAFAPDHGETSLGLTEKFPGSTLGGTVRPARSATARTTSSSTACSSLSSSPPMSPPTSRISPL